MRRVAAFVQCSVVFNQDEDTLTLKANKATTAPDLILDRWPSPRGAGPAKHSCYRHLVIMLSGKYGTIIRLLSLSYKTVQTSDISSKICMGRGMSQQPPIASP